MTSLSDGPFQRVERRAALELGTTLSEHAGQARLVCLLRSHPGWIYKEYNADTQRQTEDAKLDRLIAFPARLSHPEREIVRAATSWPTARVVGDDGTLGVILPLAPDTFRADVRLPSGTRSTQLRIDLLAQPDAGLQRRGLPPQPLVHRLRVCLSLVTAAELLERHGIVYLDWSFTNAFWSLRTLTAYLIDIDSCSFGSRPLIQSQGWDDPLVPMGGDGDQTVDRYRVALLVGRCLTGARMTPDVPPALARLAEAEPRMRTVCGMVGRALSARTVDERPPVAALAAVLRTAAVAFGVPSANGLPTPGSTGNVATWVPVGQRGPSTRRPSTGATAAPPLPAVPEPRPALDPRPDPAPRPVPAAATAEPPRPWTTPAPVPRSEPSLPAAAQAALVLLGVVLAVVLLIIVFTIL